MERFCGLLNGPTLTLADNGEGKTENASLVTDDSHEERKKTSLMMIFGCFFCVWREIEDLL